MSICGHLSSNGPIGRRATPRQPVGLDTQREAKMSMSMMKLLIGEFIRHGINGYKLTCASQVPDTRIYTGDSMCPLSVPWISDPLAGSS